MFNIITFGLFAVVVVLLNRFWRSDVEPHISRDRIAVEACVRRRMSGEEFCMTVIPDRSKKTLYNYTVIEYE